MIDTEATVKMEGETSRAVDRALTLLDALSRADTPLGTRELSRALGYPLAATHRILATLQGHGFIRQDPISDKYTLGPKLLELSARFVESFDVRRVALPILREIRERCDETVSLFIVDGDHRVCVESLESRQSVRRVVSIGTRLPLQAGATGKLLLAYLPEGYREKLLARPLDRYTATTVTDATVLQQQFAAIREQGWACSEGERVEGTGSVAAVIFGSIPGQAVAALTISTPISRFTPEWKDTVVALARQGAGTISAMLGARPDHLELARSTSDPGS